LLTALTVGLSGVLWWRLQPSPPSPALPPPKPRIRATLDRPLHSRFIPGVTFLYPAEQVEPDPANSGGHIDYLKVSGQTCEQYAWETPLLKDYPDILRRFYRQIRSLGATIVYTDSTPIPLPPPDPGRKRMNLRIDGQDPYSEFLFKSKLYASIAPGWRDASIMICSSDAISSK
jgi:hypothetical protein